MARNQADHQRQCRTLKRTVRKVPNNRYSQLSRITEKSILMPLCQCPLCPPLPEGFHYSNNGDIEDRRDPEGFKGL